MDPVRDIVTYVVENRYIGAGAIILLSFVLAFLVDVVVVRTCRVMSKRTASTLDDRIIDILHRPVRISVVLLGLWSATERLALPERAVSIIAPVLVTLATFLWLTFAVRFSSIILAQLSSYGKTNVIEPRTRPLFENLARIFLIAVAVYLIFKSWGIDVTAWLASAGIIGLAVGFAAKDTLANFFSGIFILADAPYKVDDYINLDSGERGKVVHIGLRSTRLLTRDDVEIIIPNAVIANAKVVNESGGPWAKERIRVKVGVAYGTDVDHLRTVLEQIAREHPQTSNQPEPRVRFRSFGDSSIDFELLCWIDEPVLRGRVIDALNTEIYKCLAQEKIEIPYPKRDLYIRQMPASS